MELTFPLHWKKFPKIFLKIKPSMKTSSHRFSLQALGFQFSWKPIFCFHIQRSGKVHGNPPLRVRGSGSLKTSIRFNALCKQFNLGTIEI